MFVSFAFCSLQACCAASDTDLLHELEQLFIADSLFGLVVLRVWVDHLIPQSAQGHVGPLGDVE